MRTQELLSHGVPQFAVDRLLARGITDLDALQVQAIEAGVLEGRNVAVMAPTSSGKTLVAELAALKYAVHGRGSILITSLKALAYEKYVTFRDSYSEPNNFFMHTSLATADEITDEYALSSSGLTIATYEKWYYTLVERPHLVRIKPLLIVDELQIMGDSERGWLLETLLAWIKRSQSQTQIIALSATFPNIGEVADWLNASVVESRTRVVPLVEEVRGASAHYQRNRDIDARPRRIHSQLMDTDTLSTVRSIEDEDGLPAIVFCVTKDRAESLAAQLSESRERRPDSETLVQVLEEVVESNPTARILSRALPKGVAFHNANLRLEERRLVERAFREGRIDVIFATPTLSAGVNLPAKTVILDSCHRPWVPEYYATAEYLNMAGRAGRRGLQESGRSVLLARSRAEEERYLQYLDATPERVTSKLVGDRLERVLLQTIASRVVTSIEDVEGLLAGTFAAHSMPERSPISLEEARVHVERLVNTGMVRQRVNGTLATTDLGGRVARSGVLPSTGSFLYERLEQASANFEPSRREALERPVLLLTAACPDLSPTVSETALMFVHFIDPVSQVFELRDYFDGLVTDDDLVDSSRSMVSAFVAYRYIQVHPYSQICGGWRYVNQASIHRVAGFMGWMLKCSGDA